MFTLLKTHFAKPPAEATIAELCRKPPSRQSRLTRGFDSTINFWQNKLCKKLVASLLLSAKSKRPAKPMGLPFTEAEVASIASIVARKESPDESDFSHLAFRPQSEYLSVVEHFKAFFLDPRLNTSALTEMINRQTSFLTRSQRTQPPPIVTQPSILSMTQGISLPPKMRAKAMTASSMMNNPFSSSPIPLQDSRSGSAEFHPVAQPARSFPILPRLASLPNSSGAKHKSKKVPTFGSLSVVIHPLLGTPQICRVLGSKVHNGTENFLVAFFLREFSPCYVSEDCLYELSSETGFPLGKEEEWKEEVKGDVSVDWLFERIIKSAQILVCGQFEFLSSSGGKEQKTAQLQPRQTQEIIFQSVACAAHLVLCYIVGRWQIPKEKIKVILRAIFKACPTRFESTQTILAGIEGSLKVLLDLGE